MDKINIAELLKDCPKGMELDCTMYDNLHFDKVDDYYEKIHCYIQYKDDRTHIVFGKDGTYNSEKASKCVIFPKGKTTWEGFVPPCKFNDGDIISNGICICIYNGNESENYYGLYVGVGHIDYPNYFIVSTQNSYFTKKNARLATEEEKQKLFDAIKEDGYQWNAETKTLEKLFEPKFKVGDKVRHKNNPNRCFTITDIEEDSYICGAETEFWICDQDNYELAPNKFDINTLKPFDKVLVRDSNTFRWSVSLFSHIWSKTYFCVGGWYNQCIPYEGNRHLLGTTDDCDEYYKTWEE